jgi:2-hydroxychromene-2-carboxylate isomerase
LKLPFYFDYACPWAYLGSCRVESYFADSGVEIDYRPVRLPRLVEDSGPRGLPSGDRKRRWYVSDLRAWAAMVGAELAPLGPEARRPDTRLLLQAALVAGDRGAFREFHHPAYRARWAEGRNVDEPEVVRELLAGAGLDGDAALAEAESEVLRERLDAATEAARERGVFGVPTIFVGDRMFWGNDRFELVRHVLDKER